MKAFRDALSAKDAPIKSSEVKAPPVAKTPREGSKGPKPLLIGVGGLAACALVGGLIYSNVSKEQKPTIPVQATTVIPPTVVPTFEKKTEPTPKPEATKAPVATNTHVPVATTTNTAVPPTATKVPTSTFTPVPPTSTPIPPTATAVPSPTKVPPTATSVPTSIPKAVAESREQSGLAARRKDEALRQAQNWLTAKSRAGITNDLPEATKAKNSFEVGEKALESQRYGEAATAFNASISFFGKAIDNAKKAGASEDAVRTAQSRARDAAAAWGALSSQTGRTKSAVADQANASLRAGEEALALGELESAKRNFEKSEALFKAALSERPRVTSDTPPRPTAVQQSPVLIPQRREERPTPKPTVDDRKINKLGGPQVVPPSTSGRKAEPID